MATTLGGQVMLKGRSWQRGLKKCEFMGLMAGSEEEETSSDCKIKCGRVTPAALRTVSPSLSVARPSFASYKQQTGPQWPQH